MSLWVCLDCTTAFAVGAPRCPHCGSERHAEEHEAAALGIQHGALATTTAEEDDHMPKITRHGGPSVPPVEADEVEGGEDVSAGEDSSNSSGTAEPKSASGSASNETSPSRARKTGSRSSRGQTDSSTARTTGGGRTVGQSETGSADE